MGAGEASEPRGGGAGKPPARVGGEISSTEIFTEGRRSVLALSLKLGNAGFARSLADERRLGQWTTDIV